MMYRKAGTRPMLAFTLILGLQVSEAGQYAGEWLQEGSSWLDTTSCELQGSYAPCRSFLIQHHFIDGDSLFQGRVYKRVLVEKLIYRRINQWASSCPDTTYVPPRLEWMLRDSAGMIFGLRRPSQNYGDTIEKLYFDHRGQVGQFLVDTGFWFQPTLVNSIDSIHIAEDWRKRYHVMTTGQFTPYNYVVTEGVGWLRGEVGTFLSTPGVISYCIYSRPCFSIGDTTYYPEFSGARA